ncbi:MAG: hypothetical protein ACL93V_02580 [Candidatus Electrothrix sp. YB6]
MIKTIYKIAPAVVAAILFGGSSAQALDINGTSDTAVIDGSFDEWDLANDISFPMHEAGQLSKTHFSNAYLRYDCNSKTMSVLVLDKDIPGSSVMNDGNYPNKTADNAWVKVDGFNGNMVDGRDDNGGNPTGNPPEFSWIAPDGVEQSTLLGWEGSFKIEPGNYSGIEIHVNMNGGDTSSTGKSGNRIPLNIQCPVGPDPDDPKIDIEKATNGIDADEAPGPNIEEGQPVEWTYIVTNIGNVTLNNVAVTDNLEGIISCPDTVLAAGDSMTCTASGIAAVGQYANIGTVTGEHEGNEVTDKDPSHYNGTPSFTPAPAIDIEKSINGADADTGSGLTLLVGQPVTWAFDVENTGNVLLENILLNDDILGQITCPQATLRVGESMTCTATGLAEAGQHENNGCIDGDYVARDAEGNETDRTTVKDCDPSHYFGADPELDIEKHTQGFDADTETGPFIEVGDPVFWLYSVTNTGNVPLENIAVTDDKGVAVDCGGGSNIISSLQPDESFNCSGTGIAAEGQYENLGSADSTFKDDEETKKPVHDDDPSHYFGALPGIDMEKCTAATGLDACLENDDANHDIAPGMPALDGDTVVWTYVITNTGNVALDNVAATDDQGVMLDCGDGSNIIGVLEAGASVTCTGSGVATLGQYANNGCTSGDYTVIIDADGTEETRTATDCDPSHYYGFSKLQPSLEVSVTDYSVSGLKNNGNFVVENASGDVDALYLRDVSVEIEYRVPDGNKWLDIPVHGTCTFDPSFPFVLEGDGEWVDQELRGQQEFSFSCTAEADDIPEGYTSARATICVQLFNREDKVKGKYTGDEKWFCSSKSAM